VVFNEKVYKDLLTERSTSEKDLRVASRSTLEQRDAVKSEFVEFDDAFVKKVRNIPNGNEELRVELLTPQSELRRSTRTTKALERFSYLALSVG